MFRWLGCFVGVSMQVAIIATMLRGSHRKYPLLFLLFICEFLGSIASAAALFDLGHWTRETARIYWMSEGVQFVLLFAFLVHMLFQCMENVKKRSFRTCTLVLGAILYSSASALLAYDVKLSLWMTQLVRNLSFGCMLLNFALWTFLVRRMDRERMQLAAGVGILLAGNAIGHSFRQMAPGLVALGNMIMLISYLFYLGIIFYTVRHSVTAKVAKSVSVVSEQTQEAV